MWSSSFQCPNTPLPVACPINTLFAAHSIYHCHRCLSTGISFSYQSDSVHQTSVLQMPFSLWALTSYTRLPIKDTHPGQDLPHCSVLWYVSLSYLTQIPHSLSQIMAVDSIWQKGNGKELKIKGGEGYVHSYFCFCLNGGDLWSIINW